MDRIERLRALETYCLEQAELMERMIKSGGVDEAYGIGAGNAYKMCAGRVTTLIAELGQEVGADWSDWFETWAKARGMTMQLTADGRFLCPDTALAQSAHEAGCMVSHMYYMELCRQEELAKTSPAHTSEARDGEVAELIEATRRLTADIEFRIDDPRSQLLDRARRATTAAVGCNCPGSAKVSYLSHAPNCPAREALGKFAAMRQEAGDAD